MKKLCSVFLLLIMVGGLVLSTGCGDSGGGILGAVGTFLVIAVMASAGPASVVAFAASHREKTASVHVGSRGRVSVSNLRIRVTPMNKTTGVADTASALEKVATLAADLTSATTDSKFQFANSTTNQFAVEVVTASGSGLVIKSVTTVPTVDGNATALPDNTTTKKAAMYEDWVALNKTNGTLLTAKNFDLNLSGNAAANAELNTGALLIANAIASNADAIASGNYSLLTDANSGIKTPATITQSIATATLDDPSGINVPVPTTKNTDKSLDVAETPISLGIFESLKTASELQHGSKRGSVVVDSSISMPSLIPVIGGNKALDLGGMASILFRAAGSTAATDGPTSGGNTKVYFTATTLETQNYSTHNGVTIMTSKSVLSGVTVTATGTVISKVELTANTVMTLEIYDEVSGNLVNRTVITPTKGVSGSITYDRVSQRGFYPEYVANGLTYGFIYDAIATQTMQFTLADPTFKVEYESFNTPELTGKSTGNISLAGVSGSLTEINCNYIGGAGYKDGSGNLIYYQPSAPKDDQFSPDGSTSITNSLVFAGNKLVFHIDAALSNSMTLDHLDFTFPNIVKTDVGNEIHFAFSGGSGEALLNYSGTKVQDFGYIKALKVNYSALSFDSTRDPNPISDGALLTATKTNSDNTVSTLNYKWTGGNLVLVDSNGYKFEGGNEVITTATNGDVTIKGSVTIKDPAAKQLAIEYTTIKSSTGVTAAITMAYGASSQVMTYKWTDSPAMGQPSLSNGAYAVGGIPFATFSGSKSWGTISWLPASGKSGMSNYNTDF
ncbi:MAG: hypothetical protein WA705_26020 [Candidatus Ozemobacteraceae bacterium]